mgnify:CR=1 FL=1
MGKTRPANLSDRRRAERLAKSRQLARQGRVAEAERTVQALVAKDPADVEAVVLLARLLAATGRANEGLGLLRQAGAGEAGHDAGLDVAGGEILAGLGRWEPAMAAFRTAWETEPATPGAGYGLATCLRMLGRLEEADAAYRSALEYAPDDPLLAEAAGSLAYELGRNREAETLLRKAIGLAPTEPDAYANLAVLLESEQRLDEARQIVEQGLRRRQDHPMLQLIAAKLDIRSGALAAAEQRLRAGPRPEIPPPVRRAWLFERGRLLDRLDRPDEAFALLQEAKALAAHFDPGSAEARRALLARIEREDAALRSAPGLAAGPPADGRRSPIFLVGFPRSGTTLLHHILDSHPALAVIEEQPLLEAAIAAIPGHPESLATVPAEALDRAREAYWDALRRYLPDDGRRSVDKLPLNLIHLRTIRILFPDAPIVFALRHPCDVVLSGFMQDFEANAAMAFFYRLADAATLYDRVLSLAERARTGLPLSLREVRYEDLVIDFDGVVEGLLTFLGLPWDPAVRAYAETARRRGQIDTPSYSQVTRPIYTEARYRWRRYRRHLEPHLPLLAPHAARYGYSLD